MFLLVIVQYPGGNPHAQNKKVPADSSQLRVRSIPSAAMDKYRNDDDFNYKQQHPQGISWWERFMMWIARNIDTVASSNAWSAFFKFLGWGLCIFAFVYSILKFTGNKKAEELDYAVTEDDIYAINFSEAIAKAIEQKNYRLAIRLLYLQTLRRMADRELIRWKLNKTNDVYAQELYGSTYYKDFTWLTNAYDYAWYGDFPVHEQQFTQVRQYFQTFQQQLPG